MDKIQIPQIDVKFKKLVDSAIIPTYAHDGDIGMDIYATSVEYDEQYDLYKYHTGLSVETSEEYGILLFPRSSNMKKDVYLPNSVGIVDSAIYRGEIMFMFKSRISLYERSNIIGLKAFMKSLSSGLNVKEAEEKAEEAKHIIQEMTKALEFAPYEVGDRIGQIVIIPRTIINAIQVDKLSETIRGEGGFGSSGK